jgi:hypothetical protein
MEELFSRISEVVAGGMNTVERVALGVLSFIGLIVYLRWLGPPKDQKKKDVPPKAPRRKAEND